MTIYSPDVDESESEFRDRFIKCLESEGFSRSLLNEIYSAYYFETQNIIDINSTRELIFEMITPPGSIKSKLINSDSTSETNKLFSRPRGIVITDTYNNPIFPIKIPQLDTSKFDLPSVKKQFQELHSGTNLDYLPWHFVVEFIHSDYFVFNTRPIDMKFPLSNIDLEHMCQNKDDVDPNITSFLKDNPFDINQAIHITIIGDSSTDIYLQSIYELVGRICAGPILRYFKISPALYSTVQIFNIGSKFKPDILKHYLRR